jgi:hypothetical protein
LIDIYKKWFKRWNVWTHTWTHIHVYKTNNTKAFGGMSCHVYNGGLFFWYSTWYRKSFKHFSIPSAWKRYPFIYSKYKAIHIHILSIINDKMKKVKCHTPNTQIHDHSLFCLGTGTSIKSGGVKLVNGPKPPLSEMMRAWTCFFTCE